MVKIKEGNKMVCVSVLITGICSVEVFLLGCSFFWTKDGGYNAPKWYDMFAFINILLFAIGMFLIGITLIYKAFHIIC